MIALGFDFLLKETFGLYTYRTLRLVREWESRGVMYRMCVTLNLLL